MLNDEVSIDVILKAILNKTILINPLYELPHKGTQMEIEAFNFFVRDDDLRRFRINCKDHEVFKTVPVDELGFWTKLGLGWWDGVRPSELPKALHVCKQNLRLAQIKNGA